MNEGEKSAIANVKVLKEEKVSGKSPHRGVSTYVTKDSVLVEVIYV